MFGLMLLNSLIIHFRVSSLIGGSHTVTSFRLLIVENFYVQFSYIKFYFFGLIHSPSRSPFSDLFVPFFLVYSLHPFLSQVTSLIYDQNFSHPREGGDCILLTATLYLSIEPSPFLPLTRNISVPKVLSVIKQYCSSNFEFDPSFVQVRRLFVNQFSKVRLQLQSLVFSLDLFFLKTTHHNFPVRDLSFTTSDICSRQ